RKWNDKAGTRRVLPGGGRTDAAPYRGPAAECVALSRWHRQAGILSEARKCRIAKWRSCGLDREQENRQTGRVSDAELCRRIDRHGADGSSGNSSLGVEERSS